MDLDMEFYDIFVCFRDSAVALTLLIEGVSGVENSVSVSETCNYI
jgi:hypothetical protein